MTDIRAELADSRRRLVTEGSLHKAFFVLAGPAVAAMSVEFLLAFTDMIWVGKIGGPVPVAVVTSSMFSLWIVWSLVSTISTGTVAVVSRHFGRGDYEQAQHVASHAMGSSIWFAAIVTIVGVAVAPVAFHIMQTSDEVTAGGTIYLRIRLASAIIFIFLEVLGSVFRASGDTKTPMIIMFIAVGANIVLDPLLIFGIGPFPEMGTTGAAVASVAASVISLITALLFLKRGKLALDIDWNVFRKIDLKIFWKIVKIGIPLSISGVLFSLIYFFINRIAAQFGDATVAAMGIGNRCESISYLICFGASLATATLVGQNLGANDPQRAERAGWWSLFYTGIFTGLITALFLLVPESISRIFIDDPAVEPMVVDYLMIIGVSQIFMAAEIVLEGAFSGAGDTMPPMLIGVSWTLLRIPMAYLLCFTFDLGPAGIWYTISATTIVKGTIMVLWFKRGKWKSKQVD